jgi:hypothetical protein
MITTRHAVDFVYTGPELAMLFRYARAHDVEQGGRYDTRSAAIILWSHHWQHTATREESEILGTFDVRWDPFVLWQIECEAGFSLEDLMQALGRLELCALGYLKHGDVPREEHHE